MVCICLICIWLICFVFSEHIVSMYVKGSWGDMIVQTAATNFLNRTIKSDKFSCAINV